jgi:diaminohydroxyphosphoribosylaminopyrimidine deaminase / 5-amino-6-(5-phosphoribosylamino)uracil reductase
VLEDDPRLDVRLVETARQPMRVIVDSRLQTPPTARILQPPGQVLVYGAAQDDEAAARLRATGAELVWRPSASGKVDLAALLDDLAARQINEVHVEAGYKLNGSLLSERLVDELVVYVAPRLLGAGRDMAALGPLKSLADGIQLHFTGIEPFGDDLRVTARTALNASRLSGQT